MTNADAVPIIEVIDADHIRFNGWLLDMPQVWAWYNSRTWPPHSPFNFLQILHRNIQEPRWTNGDHDCLFHQLATLNSWGYHVPDEAFARYPSGRSYFYRTANGHIVFGDLNARLAKQPTYKIGTPRRSA